MECREFVKLAKREAVDSAVQIVMQRLRSPRVPAPPAAEYPAGSPGEWIHKRYNQAALEEQFQAAWFATLDAGGREILRELLAECAELAGFGFFTLIDGVGGDCDGVFEIIHVSGDEERTVLNPQNTEMLHNVFSEICEAERDQSPSATIRWDDVNR